MVPKLTATTFIKAFHTGRTCPCLMLCEDDAGDTQEVVVKLRVGNECTGTGLICELMGSLLARALDLPAPEPFLVDVDPEFHAAIAEESIAERLKANAGMNFGCRYLSPGYISWPQLRSVPSAIEQVAAEIFAFDMLIQNPDRRQDKPNLLRKGDDLAIFDHEMAFSFLYALVPDEFPWEGKGMDFAMNHVFYRGLKGQSISFERMQGALEAVDGVRISEYVDAVPSVWKSNNDAVNKIKGYLELANSNSGVLFQKILEVLI